MQQLVTEVNRQRFFQEVNDLLMDNWKIVPGTMYIASVRAVASNTTPDWFRLEDGTTYQTLYSVALERDDVN